MWAMITSNVKRNKSYFYKIYSLYQVYLKMIFVMIINGPTYQIYTNVHTGPHSI